MTAIASRLTTPESERERVLVACEPVDIADDTFNGLSVRHGILLARLFGSYDVSFLVVRRADTTYAPIAERFSGRVAATVTVPPPDGRRASRLAGVCRELAGVRLADWEHQMLEAAKQAAPDMVLTVGPWLDREYRCLSRSYRTLHLFEESVEQMAENAPQSRRAKWFRRALAVIGQRSGPLPRVVLTISAREARNIRRRYPGARVEVLPEIVPADCWFDGHRQPRAGTVLVVGNLTENRHVEGLIPVLDLLQGRTGLQVEVISDKGLHPLLQEAAAEGTVVHRPAPDPLQGAYRDAAVALVPAMRATGMKGTLLRAWAAGCPVVTYTGSADTVGATDGVDVLSRADPRQVAEAVVALLDDPALQARLSTNGRRQMNERFDPAIVLATYDAYISELLADTVARSSGRSV